MVFAPACYDESPMPAASTEAAVAAPAGDTTRPSPGAPSQKATATASTIAAADAADPAMMDTWAATIRVITGRLSRNARQQSTTTADLNPSWRAPELEKLQELLTSCCSGASAICQACIAPIAREQLPADELWPLIGQFLGPLRPHAQMGFLALGAPLLTHSDGEVRDRVFRMAVAAGVSRRGQPDDQNRRAASVPLVPRVGQPTWLVIEQLSPCPRLRADVKGPDRSGRIDVALEDQCSPKDWAVVADAFPPRATRGVWGVAVGPLPMGGLDLWMSDADQPLLQVRAGRETRSGEGDARSTTKATRPLGGAAGN